jgi:hypothetical protein
VGAVPFLERDDANPDHDASFRVRSPDEFASGERVGIMTGKPSGRFVVEFDGPEAVAWLAEQEAEHGSLPRTAEVKSARGRHVHFRMPPEGDVRNSAGKVGPKVDVRGTGGFVVAPPSDHKTGHVYSWTVEPEVLADAPAWLLALAQGAAKTRESDVSLRPEWMESPPPEYLDKWRDAARDWLQRRAKPPASGQASRWDWYVAGHVVRSFGVPYEEAEAMIEEHAASVCDPGVMTEEHGGIGNACYNAEHKASAPTWGLFLTADLRPPGAPPPKPDAPSAPEPVPSPAPTVNDAPAVTRQPWTLGAVPVSEFLAMQFPRPERIVGSFLKGTLAMIYGSAGSLKSWLAMEITRQAALTGTSTVYVLEEGMPCFMQGRLAGLGIGPRTFFAMRRGFIVHDRQKLDALIAYAKSVNAGLIVLDPLSDMNEKDENVREEMLEVRRALARLADETGACVLVVHHSSKSGGRQGKFDLGSDMANARGSGVLQGAVDLMFELRRDPENPHRALVFNTKNRNESMEFEGSVELVRDEAGRVSAVKWVHGEEARAEFDARKAKKEAEKRVEKGRAEELGDDILRAAGQNPGASKAELIRAVVAMAPGRSDRTVERRIDALLGEKRLRNLGNGTGFRLHLPKGATPPPDREPVEYDETGDPYTPGRPRQCVMVDDEGDPCGDPTVEGTAWCRAHFDERQAGGR